MLVRGLIIGFSIAAPVGPIGVLCIRRTLADGRVYGLVSGLGAASADAIYGFIAAFGLTFISDLLIDNRAVLSLVGGVFLLVLGIRTFRARPAENAAAVSGRPGLIAAYASTFFLTLTNPMTILSFAAIFAGVASPVATTHTAAAVLVLGVFGGSALWWLTLTGGVSLLRERFNARWMLAVNRMSGTIITAFGVLALSRLV